MAPTSGPNDDDSWPQLPPERALPYTPRPSNNPPQSDLVSRSNDITVDPRDLSQNSNESTDVGSRQATGEPVSGEPPPHPGTPSNTPQCELTDGAPEARPPAIPDQQLQTGSPRPAERRTIAVPAAGPSSLQTTASHDVQTEQHAETDAQSTLSERDAGLSTTRSGQSGQSQAGQPTSAMSLEASLSSENTTNITTAEHHLRQQTPQPARTDSGPPRLRPPIEHPLASSRDTSSGHDCGTLREDDPNGLGENVVRPSGSGERFYPPELPPPASSSPPHRPPEVKQPSPNPHPTTTNSNQAESQHAWLTSDLNNNMINGRDGQPVQRISEQINLTVDAIKDSLSSLNTSAMLAERIPYISTTAGLLLQVLTTQNDVNQHKERWSSTKDKVLKLAALVSNVGRTCENNSLEEDDLPQNLPTISQSLVTELIQIERALKKGGSLKRVFLGMYLRRKVKKYDRKIFNVLQVFHVTLAFNQRFSHCAERIEVEVIDVNTRYDEDQTPLHVASQLGQREIMRSLLARGANPNSENATKETPLFMASRKGNIEIIQLLLENRANVNHPDLEKRTPLHEASENGHDSVVQLLLGFRANCDAKNMYQWTPLHIASRTGNSAVIRILLDWGADVNVQNISKWTPLHMASQKGYVEAIHLLLARNARVDEKKADGETALHLAAYYGQGEVVGFLISHNADQHIRNNKGETALDIAREKGRENVVQLIEDQPSDSTSSSLPHVAPTVTKTASGRSHTDPSAASRAPPLPPEHPASAAGSPSREAHDEPKNLPASLVPDAPRHRDDQGHMDRSEKLKQLLLPTRDDTGEAVCPLPDHSQSVEVRSQTTSARDVRQLAALSRPKIRDRSRLDKSPEQGDETITIPPAPNHDPPIFDTQQGVESHGAGSFGDGHNVPDRERPLGRIDDDARLSQGPPKPPVPEVVPIPPTRPTMPSSSKSATLRGEGIWRQASNSNLDQEMFGQAPGTPTLANVSPLYSVSSSERTLPTHASLLSPYDDLGASSRSQSSLPESSITMRSAAPTIPQPVQFGFPHRIKHEWAPVNTTTTHHHKAQPEDIGPTSGGRRLGLWGRLWKSFRGSFRVHALLCIPIRPAAERPGHTPSKRRVPRNTAAGGEKPISTRTQNTSDTQIPLSPGSLDAFEGPSPQRDRRDPPVTLSDGAYKEGARMEVIIGTPGQHPSADLDPPMLATSPNSVPPFSNTSAEPPLCTKTLYTELEPGEQEPEHDHPDVGHGVSASAGHRTGDYKPRRNVPESDGGGYNGPARRAPRKTVTMSKHSFSTTGTSSIGSNSDNGQNDGHRGVKVFLERIPE